VAALGAISFAPGVFNNRLTFCDPLAPATCKFLPTPYKAGTYTWQAALPAYAQGVFSRIEDDLRASVLTWHSANTTTMIRRPSGDPRAFVVARQVLEADGDPRRRWIVAASYQPYSYWNQTAQVGEDNTITQLAAKERAVRFTLGGSDPLANTLVRLPARQQGSVYTLDLADPSNPILIQYDAWHDWKHPSYWAKDFRYDAEVNDAQTNGTLGETLVTRTAAPGAGSLGRHARLGADDSARLRPGVGVAVGRRRRAHGAARDTAERDHRHGTQPGHRLG